MKQGGRTKARLPRREAETSSACQISQLVCFLSIRRPSEGICWCRYCKYCRVLLETGADADNTPWHSLSLSPRRGAALIGLCAEGNQHNFLPVLKYRCLGGRGNNHDCLTFSLFFTQSLTNMWINDFLHIFIYVEFGPLHLKRWHNTRQKFWNFSEITLQLILDVCADVLFPFCYGTVLLFCMGSGTRELFPNNCMTQTLNNDTIPNVSIWNGRGTTFAQPPVKTFFCFFSFCKVD